MGELSDIDWAQYIKMDYAQNLSKHPKKANKQPSEGLKKVLPDIIKSINEIEMKSLSTVS